jgi:hypothetical protein
MGIMDIINKCHFAIIISDSSNALAAAVQRTMRKKIKYGPRKVFDFIKIILYIITDVDWDLDMPGICWVKV